MIKIKGIEIYHSDNKVGNEKYLENNEEHRYFLENVLGKKNRYIKDEKEHTLSYMKKAAEKVLKNNNLTGQDIDMVVCATQTPEFLIPTMSAVLHNYLNVKTDSAFYDINVACIGMVFAFDQAYNMMLNSKDLNRVLIVGCDLLEQYVYEKSNNYGNFGDLACAIILEKDYKENGSRIIATKHFADTTQKHCMMFPPFKLSQLINGATIDEEFKMVFSDNLSANFPLAKENLTKILEQNNVDSSEIAMLCTTQGAFVALESIRKHLNIPEERSLFVGKDYGYNACSSPFVVLYEALQKGLVKRGDKVLFWTYGAGCQHIITLIEF